MIYIYHCGDWFEIISLVLYEGLQNNNIPCQLSRDLAGHPDDTWLLFEWFFNLIPWPKKYIVYQVAPMLSRYGRGSQDLYIKMLRGAIQIWEYSKLNLSFYTNDNFKQPIIYLPFRYTLCLETWNGGTLSTLDCDEKPIVDVFFNGFKTAYREGVIAKLRAAGLNVLCSYGDIDIKKRDIIAQKAKVNLILHKESHLNQFPQDISRIFPLGAKHCFLISEPIGECPIQSLIQCPIEKLIETILFFIKNEDHRQKNIEQVYQEIKSKTMSDIISTAIIHNGLSC